MSEKPLAKLLRFLATDPEIVGLKKRYHDLTGKHLSGWNWDQFADLNVYVAYLRRKVAEAEAAAEKEKIE